MHSTSARQAADVAVEADLARESAVAVLHPPVLIQALAHLRASWAQKAAYNIGIKAVEDQVEYKLW